MRVLISIALLALSLSAAAESRSPQSIQKQFDYYYYAAERHIAQEEYEQAMSCILLCESLQPKDPQVLSLLGRFYTAMDDKERAYRYYREAYELCPEEMWQQYWLLERNRSLEANDAKGALRAQDEIDKRQGRNRQSVYLRMRIGELTGLKWKKQAALYEEMLGYDPDDAYVLNNYAYGLALHHGNLKRAEEMVQRALAKDPRNPAYLDTYATILEMSGRKQLAEQYRRMIPKQ